MLFEIVVGWHLREKGKVTLCLEHRCDKNLSWKTINSHYAPHFRYTLSVGKTEAIHVDSHKLCHIEREFKEFAFATGNSLVLHVKTHKESINL